MNQECQLVPSICMASHTSVIFLLLCNFKEIRHVFSIIFSSLWGCNKAADWPCIILRITFSKKNLVSLDHWGHQSQLIAIKYIDYWWQAHNTYYDREVRTFLILQLWPYLIQFTRATGDSSYSCHLLHKSKRMHHAVISSSSLRRPWS